MQHNLKAMLTVSMLAMTLTPAAAQWDRLGVVTIDHRSLRDSQYAGFGGPVEQLHLRSDQTDIQCHALRALAKDGQTIYLWSGRLKAGKSQIIDLPRQAVALHRLDFRCQSLGSQSARLEIYADIGAWHHDTARREQRPAQRHMMDWIALGAARFGRQIGDKTVSGANGHHYRQIALRSRGGDAQCRTVTIRFTNGARAVLRVPGGDHMKEDLLYHVDLPGQQRNILRLALECQSLQAEQISVQVQARR